MPANDNLALWESVEKTDPKATKGFQGKGGFKGTAISPMWLIMRATAKWGPMGSRWGIRIIAERVQDGAPLIGKDGGVVGRASVHIVQAEVYYPTDDITSSQGTVPCFGQTEFCGMRKSGDFYTDEEAPKKSLTDALTKGLSWLGFAADVHMGLYDDCKYVAQVGKEFEEEARRDAAQDKLASRDDIIREMDSACYRGRDAFAAAWKAMSKEDRELVKDKMPHFEALCKGGKAVPSA